MEFPGAAQLNSAWPQPFDPDQPVVEFPGGFGYPEAGHRTASDRCCVGVDCPGNGVIWAQLPAVHSGVAWFEMELSLQ